MKVKEHYDSHLGKFYSWMCGDFNQRQLEMAALFREHLIFPGYNKIAFDLGAGHGIQSVPLAKLGFDVKAVDFNKQLIHELSINKENLKIDIVENDILAFMHLEKDQAELVVCMGDTLTHLQSVNDVNVLIRLCAERLVKKGKIILSFRDLTTPAHGTQRFIHVKSDEERILTCFLEDMQDYIMVHDIFLEKHGETWRQSVSAYPKLKLKAEHVLELLHVNNIRSVKTFTLNRMTYIFGTKGN